MSKLGYTFYPKDWSCDDDVFELNLEQRGLYREIIDLAMLNDNKVVYKPNVWARKFNIPQAKLEGLVEGLLQASVIVQKPENEIHVPSCEKRLVFVRAGKKGGTSKGGSKGTSKGIDKPNANQRERERERERESKTKDKEKGVDYFLEKLRKVETQELSDNSGFKAKSFQYFEKVRGGYAWQSVDELDQFDVIKKAIYNRIKSKDPSFLVKDVHCYALFMDALDEAENDKFWAGCSIYSITKNIDRFLNMAKKPKGNGR